MNDIEKEIEKVLEVRERTIIFAQFQNMEKEKGAIPPDPPLVLRRRQRMLERVGGALLGFFVAVITLYFNFLLFVWLLHIEF